MERHHLEITLSSGRTLVVEMPSPFSLAEAREIHDELLEIAKTVLEAASDDS